jgi:DNA-binding HxlR family transcriptional regulator|tara:strand:+ start:2085 stop:2531 length:447 start_codon:yes stop_codon:yes gene_type:complete
MSLKESPTCAIARSIQLLGDKWSILILRDVILHKKCRFKEFKSSKEKIATNILSNRLKFLIQEGLLEKLDPLGTKKSTRYIATDKGLSSIPIIIELYLFSFDSINESILDDSQINIKHEITSNRNLFEVKSKVEYINFVNELSELILS